MMKDQFALIATFISGLTAVVSVLTTLVAFRLARRTVDLIKSKEGRLQPGPDVEEGLSSAGDSDEADA